MGDKKKESLFLESDFSRLITNQNEFPLGLDFFSYFVHELKAPLLSLSIELDRLKEDQSIPQQRLDQMEKYLKNTFQFIEDSVRLQNLEEKPNLTPQWITLKSLYMQSKENIETVFEHKKIQLQSKGLEDFEVYVDQRWMVVVLRNLLLNAAQHSSKNSKIQIYADDFSDGQYLKISIIDEGPGIPLDRKSKVFDCFQSCRGNDGSHKGTGLGLFIAKSIVKCHGGEIGLESWDKIEKKGCIFYFILPNFKKSTLQNIS